MEMEENQHPADKTIRRALNIALYLANEAKERAARELQERQEKVLADARVYVAEAILLWGETPLPSSAVGDLSQLIDDTGEATFEARCASAYEALRVLGDPAQVQAFLDSADASPWLNRASIAQDELLLRELVRHSPGPASELKAAPMHASDHPKTADVWFNRQADAWLKLPESEWVFNSEEEPVRFGRFGHAEWPQGFEKQLAERPEIFEEYRRRAVIVAERHAARVAERKARDERKPALFAKIFDTLGDDAAKQGFRDGKIRTSGAIELLWKKVFSTAEWSPTIDELEDVDALPLQSFYRAESFKARLESTYSGKLSRHPNWQELAPLGPCVVSWQQGRKRGAKKGAPFLLICTLVLDDTLKVQAQVEILGPHPQSISTPCLGLQGAEMPLRRCRGDLTREGDACLPGSSPRSASSGSRGA